MTEGAQAHKGGRRGGSRGPVPKRSAERRRTNKESVPDKVKPAILRVEQPTLEKLHPVAMDWYESLPTSAQTQFYEPSDWAVARMCAFEIDAYYKSLRPSAGAMQNIIVLMDRLMITEPTRRRLGIEVDRDGEGKGEAEAEAESATKMANFRKERLKRGK